MAFLPASSRSQVPSRTGPPAASRTVSSIAIGLEFLKDWQSPAMFPNLLRCPTPRYAEALIRPAGSCTSVATGTAARAVGTRRRQLSAGVYVVLMHKKRSFPPMYAGSRAGSGKAGGCLRWTGREKTLPA